jgi:hypothetical protein
MFRDVSDHAIIRERSGIYYDAISCEIDMAGFKRTPDRDTNG